MKSENRFSVLLPSCRSRALHWIAAWSTLLFACWNAEADDPESLDAETFVTRRRAAFVAADSDGDGQLTLDESLTSFPVRDHDDATRRFLIFDFDASGKLDAEEFRAVGASVDERGDVPDPVVEMETVALAKWEAIFAAADRNRDGVLSRDEWPAERIGAEIPALAELTFAHWDRHGDGKVDRADGRWLLDVAYGLSQLDGRPLRTKTGRVFSWYYYRHLDSDTDGFVSGFEFGIRHNQGKARNDEIFAQLDANGDGKLTDRETWSLLWHDTIGQFLEYDRDQDGYLSADELEAIGWSRSIARQCIPAFDTDRDRQLSFPEFRQTTFANQTSAWPIRHDTDRDGRLSWKEFYTEKPPLLIGQYRFMFDRFDRNQDGSLSVFEFKMEGDYHPWQMLVLLRPLERSLPVEVELATRVCKLTVDQAVELEQAGYGVVEREIQKLLSEARRDLPGAAVGISAEAPLSLLPHLFLRRKLVDWLRDKSESAPSAWPRTWKDLEAECAAAEKRRRKAATLAHVAVLDQVLLLSSTQRSELSALLDQESAGVWAPLNLGNSAIDRFYATALNGRFAGVPYKLLLPNAALETKLTATQRTALKRLEEPYAMEIIVAQRAAVPGAAQAAPAQPVGAVRRMPLAPMVRRVLRSGPTVDVMAERLTLYVERRVEDISTACGLTKQQQDKLLVAAKLDLARWRQQQLSVNEQLDEGEHGVEKAQGRGAIVLPLAIFCDENSFFQKANQSRLTEDQRVKLAESDRHRRAFQGQAIVAASIVGFERTASLTSAQCEALATALNESVGDWNASGAVDVYAEWVQRIGRVPFERFQPLFYEYQIPAARQYYAELQRLIQMFEAQRARQGGAGAAGVPQGIVVQ